MNLIDLATAAETAWYHSLTDQLAALIELETATVAIRKAVEAEMRQETLECETEGERRVLCYWNGEVVDCESLGKRLLIGGGCESDSDLSVSTSPSASETVWEPSESKEDITLFFNRCANFDWFYGFSDDNNVWRRGEKNFKQLEKDSTQSPVFEKIFSDWREYISNREVKPDLESYI